ncbi:TPA: hypothetical protein ACH1J3_005016 [Citrobacter werkmanii]
MKNVLDVLHQVREKSKHIVDTSTLAELDRVIHALEDEARNKSKGITALEVMSYIAKLFALIKLLTGDTDSH